MTRRREPRPVRIVTVFALLGAALCGLVGLLRPEVPQGYSNGVAVGYLLVVGAGFGAVLGLVVTALLAGRPERPTGARRAAGAAPMTDRAAEGTAEPRPEPRD